MVWASPAPHGWLVIDRRAMEPMEGSASPRKPMVEMLSRSSCPSSPTGSLEVAWRSMARASSSALIPLPLSSTTRRTRPPPSTVMSIRVEPASSAFSTSSLITEDGRSTTSPAAIRLTVSGGRRRMMGAFMVGLSGKDIGPAFRLALSRSSQVGQTARLRGPAVWAAGYGRARSRPGRHPSRHGFAPGPGLPLRRPAAWHRPADDTRHRART